MSSSCVQYLSLIVAALLFLFLFLPAAAAAAASDSIKTNKFLDCSPRTYQCGDQRINYTISYPFRTPDMPEYCGHPKLQLACISRNSVVLLAINIAGNEYHVQAIDYNNQLINVSRLDLYSNDSSCPRMLTNTNTTSSWIDLSLFNYTNVDYYVTVYVNCSNLAAFLPDLTPIDCLTNYNSATRGYSYYSLSPPAAPVEFSESCSLIVEIPIYVVLLKYLEARVMDFVQAVRQGFELSWMAGQRWCDGCKHTGGVCGFDLSSPDSPTCFCPDGRTTPGTCLLKDEKNVKKKIAIASAVGGVVILIAACCVFFFWYKPRKKLQQSVLSNLLTQSTPSKFSSSMNDPELAESNYQTHIFSYEELQEATNGFDTSRELGDGGFCTVYKGMLRDGRTVAVKRLYENNYKRLEQFMNEVDILSRLRHQNLVTLYGCTSRRSHELLLVYEFMASGTVADHLHGTHASSGPLLWRDRMSIAIETADTLSYLHAIEPPIIHRDVKSSNILLDSNFHVKVADFGLSRLFPLDATHVSTAPQGTPGYVDPEYHQCYQLTDKSDVYSFGVVLVELISSKPAVDISRSRHEINLANMAVNRIQKRQLEQLVDPALGYHSDSEVKRMVTRVAELAFRCLQSDGVFRPSIKEVLEELKRIHSQVQNKEEEEEEDAASLISPDSVAERWHSRSTTPNNSE